MADISPAKDFFASGEIFDNFRIDLANPFTAFKNFDAGLFLIEIINALEKGIYFGESFFFVLDLREKLFGIGSPIKRCLFGFPNGNQSALKKLVENEIDRRAFEAALLGDMIGRILAQLERAEIDSRFFIAESDLFEFFFEGHNFLTSP